MSDDPEELPEEAIAMVTEFIEEHHDYLSYLGVRIESFERGRVVMRLPFDEKLTNPTSPPTMHGGIAASIIDTAGGMALRPFLDDPVDDTMATINLNVNYLRRAAGDLTAEAEVIRAGGSVGVSTVMVESETPDGEAKPVAAGQGAYRLFRSAED
jgi:uncharacterized protein (TIGR00369 family)